MELAVGLECISLPLYIARFTPRTFKSYPYKHNALTRSYACAWNIHSPSSHLDGHSKTISSSITIVPAKSIIFKCLMRLCNIRKAINIWIILCLVLYAQLAALCWTLQDPLSSLHLQHALPTSSTLFMYQKYQRPTDPLQSWIWQIPAWHSEMLHAFMNTSLLVTWVHIHILCLNHDSIMWWWFIRTWFTEESLYVCYNCCPISSSSKVIWTCTVEPQYRQLDKIVSNCHVTKDGLGRTGVLMRTRWCTLSCILTASCPGYNCIISLCVYISICMP